MTALRAVWIDEATSTESEDCDWPKLAKYGFDRLYFSSRAVKKTELDAARAHGYQVGIYRVPEWDANLGPVEWAKALSADVARLGGNGTQLAVQADIETHSTLWIAAFLAQWRRNRALRDTSVTTEGFQGGLLQQIRREILESGVQLVPQAYDGSMNPYDTDGVIRDLTDWGFPRERITVFHDAARLLRGWAGFAFTARRLS